MPPRSSDSRMPTAVVGTWLMDLRPAGFRARRDGGVAGLKDDGMGDGWMGDSLSTLFVFFLLLIAVGGAAVEARQGGEVEIGGGGGVGVEDAGDVVERAAVVVGVDGGGAVG